MLIVFTNVQCMHELSITRVVSGLLQVCAVIAAVSEIVKTKEGNDTETEYFGALVSLLCSIHSSFGNFVLSK